MLTTDRIELTLESAVNRAQTAGSPPLLASAMHYAVFPGGHRIRPQLCLAVAGACGDPLPRTTNAAAAAVELLHCASLVHDDLPASTTPRRAAASPPSTRNSASRWRC